MTVETLNRRISELGLEEQEARYFVYISITGPTPIRSIVSRYGENRVKVYRTLKKLEEKGFIEKIMGRPVKYVAKPLDELFQRSIDDLKSKISTLELSKEETVEAWRRAASSVTLVEEPRFRINQGRQQVYSHMIQMCEKATETVYLVTTESDLRRLSLYGLDDCLKSLEGVNVDIMTQVEGLDFDEVDQLYRFSQLRHVPLPSPVRFMIIDNSEVLVTIRMDDSMSMTTQNDTGLWTDAGSFVSVMKVFYDALWSLGKDIDSVLYEMRTGVKIQEMVTLRSNDEFIDYASKEMRECSKQLDIQVFDLGPELLHEISLSLQPEIECRIITQLTLENIDFYSQLGRKTEVRHSGTPTEMNLILIDGEKVIVKLPSWHNNTQSIWSNNIYYVDSMQKVFDDIWVRTDSMNDLMDKLLHEENTVKTMQRIRNMLIENNYQVESPGVITGKSGINHAFGLVASGRNLNDIIGLDFLGLDAINQISLMGAKRTDLSECKLVLLSQSRPDERVTELAKLYRIQIIGVAEALHTIENIIIEK